MTFGRAAVAAFAIGAPMLFFGKVTILTAGGVVLLLVAIGLGMFAVASPEFVAGDRDEEA
jgi:hypothetical protein